MALEPIRMLGRLETDKSVIELTDREAIEAARQDVTATGKYLGNFVDSYEWVDTTTELPKLRITLRKVVLEHVKIQVVINHQGMQTSIDDID